MQASTPLLSPPISQPTTNPSADKFTESTEKEAVFSGLSVYQTDDGRLYLNKEHRLRFNMDYKFEFDNDVFTEKRESITDHKIHELNYCIYVGKLDRNISYTYSDDQKIQLINDQVEANNRAASDQKKTQQIFEKKHEEKFKQKDIFFAKRHPESISDDQKEHKIDLTIHYKKDSFLHSSYKAAYQCFNIPCQAVVASSFGARDSMEDVHLVETCPININNQKIPAKITAVFDGHGGDQCAKYSAENIVNILQKSIEKHNKISPSGITIAAVETMGKLTEGYLNKTVEEPASYHVNAGSTANVALYTGKDLWVFNVGDSRAILVDPEGETVQITEDMNMDNLVFKHQSHQYEDLQDSVKVQDKLMKERGGEIAPNNRLYSKQAGYKGGLAIHSSLGDHHLKGAMNPLPKVTHYTAEQLQGKIMLQFSDGLSQRMSTDQIGQLVKDFFIQSGALNPEDPSKKPTAQQMTDCALHLIEQKLFIPTGLHDNSVVIIQSF